MYKENSPWNKTPIIDDLILDVLKKRFIYKDPYDEIYTIPQQFNERPDLCSYEFYGTAKYWWIFAQRNLDAIEDPIYDIVAGTQIYLPDKERVLRALGD